VRTPTAERKVPRWVRTIPDPEFPELGIASVQQDDNDKSKQACTETLGSKNDDCSVHVQRNCEQKIVHKNKRATPTAPTVLEKFQRDFNRIKNVPTLPLLWLCCYFFVNLWAASQPAMAAYFQFHAFVFRWTRVQVGAGCGSDNNPLEGTNRTQKDAVHWTRHALLKFGEVMRHWLGHKGRDDYGFNQKFNSAVWCNATFQLVVGWKDQKFQDSAIETTLDGVTVLLLPYERLSSQLDGMS